MPDRAGLSSTEHTLIDTVIDWKGMLEDGTGGRAVPSERGSTAPTIDANHLVGLLVGCHVDPLACAVYRSVMPAKTRGTWPGIVWSRDDARSAFAAQRDQLLELMRADGLDGRIAEIEPRIRDSIRIVLGPKSRAKIPLGASRLGGVPDLPAGTPWPEARGEPLSFVGQVALEDVAPIDIHDKLPAAGLLSIFAGSPLDGDGVPAPHGSVIFVEPDAVLEPAARPKPPGSWPREAPKPRRIAFEPLALLPWRGEQLPRDDIEYRDFYERHVLEDCPEPRHGMLGFDRGEPVVREGEAILLRLDQDDIPYSYDWCEAVAIYVLINDAALARGEITAIRFEEAVTL